VSPAGASHELVFSTYLGGSGGEDTARAVAVDSQGSIYVAGGTQSSDFPTTAGALDRTLATGGSSLGTRGAMDVFVTKLSAAGEIIWSTYLGGPNYDRAYSVEVAADGSVYVAGRAGDGFPTTPGVVQERFAGDSTPPVAYGEQDGFITKLAADGSRIVWSTYFGTGGGDIIRDIDVDASGHVYASVIQPNRGDSLATPMAFDTTPDGGGDSLIAKLAPDGSRVIWGSYLGGTGNDAATSVRVDSTGHVFAAGFTSSADFPVTPGAFQTNYAGGSMDAFAVKFRPDGSDLIYGTFLGGSQGDGAAGKHGLAVDAAGNAFVVGFTDSKDFPTTVGAFQTTHAGGHTGTWEQTGDRFIARLSPDGSRLLASTYLGGSARDGGEGICVGDRGQVYLSGFTYSRNFPVTADALQALKREDRDGTPVVLSADLGTTLLSTYMGGRGNDNFRACALGPDGSFVIVGDTTSRDWPVHNASQSAFAGGSTDVLVVEFSVGEPGPGTGGDHRQ